MPARNPDSEAGPASSRIFLLRVRIMTPRVAAAWANTAGKIGPAMREKPGSLYWAIMTGTSPQCTPNMTKTCQKAPMTAPATQGTCSKSAFIK